MNTVYCTVVLAGAVQVSGYNDQRAEWLPVNSPINSPSPAAVSPIPLNRPAAAQEAPIRTIQPTFIIICQDAAQYKLTQARTRCRDPNIGSRVGNGGFVH